MNQNQKTDLPEPWQWPGLWSVNLPVIIVLWQILFAKSFFVWLGAHHLFTTAALAWGVVAAERWIYFFRIRPDLAEQLLPAPKLSDQRAGMVRICLLLVIGLILVGTFRGNLREIAGVLIWTSLGGAYVAAIRRMPREMAEVLPREIGLAAYLAGIAALFTWANGVVSPSDLLLPTLLFLLLLFYYFCLVSGWAKELLPSVSGGFLDGPMARFYRGAPMLLILAAVILVLFTAQVGAKPLILSIGVSAVTLLLLDVWQQSLSRFACRILADVALLTPAVPLLIGV